MTTPAELIVAIEVAVELQVPLVEVSDKVVVELAQRVVEPDMAPTTGKVQPPLHVPILRILLPLCSHI